MKTFIPIERNSTNKDNIPNIVDVLETNSSNTLYEKTAVSFLGTVKKLGAKACQLLGTVAIASYKSIDGSSIGSTISSTIGTAKYIKDSSDLIIDQYYAGSQLIIELEFLNAILDNFIVYYNALGNFANILQIDICSFEIYTDFIQHVNMFLKTFKSDSLTIDNILSLINPIKYRVYIKELIYWNNIFFENMLSQYNIANNSVDKINMEKNISNNDYIIAISKLSKKLSCNKEIILNKLY